MQYTDAHSTMNRKRQKHLDFLLQSDVQCTDCKRIQEATATGEFDVPFGCNLLPHRALNSQVCALGHSGLSVFTSYTHKHKRSSLLLLPFFVRCAYPCRQPGFSAQMWPSFASSTNARSVKLPMFRYVNKCDCQHDRKVPANFYTR